MSEKEVIGLITKYKQIDISKAQSFISGNWNFNIIGHVEQGNTEAIYRDQSTNKSGGSDDAA